MVYSVIIQLVSLVPDKFSTGTYIRSKFFVRDSQSGSRTIFLRIFLSKPFLRDNKFESLNILFFE